MCACVFMKLSEVASSVDKLDRVLAYLGESNELYLAVTNTELLFIVVRTTNQDDLRPL